MTPLPRSYGPELISGMVKHTKPLTCVSIMIDRPQSIGQAWRIMIQMEKEIERLNKALYGRRTRLEEMEENENPKESTERRARTHG